MSYLVQRVRTAVEKRSRKFYDNIRKRIIVYYRQRRYGEESVNLVGYFSSVLGVAEVGRFFAFNLLQGRVAFSVTDVPLPSHERLNVSALKNLHPFFLEEPHFYRTIFFVNPDQLPDVHRASPQLFRNTYRVGVVWWEFNDYYTFSRNHYLLDEVVVFTEFIATALRKAAPAGVKVTKLTFPFLQNWEIDLPREVFRRQYSIPAASFVFVFNFDFYSIMERKNPEATLRAFATAFPNAADAKLILKTVHSDKAAGKAAEFSALIEQMGLSEKVILINESLSRNQMMSLIAASDAYVSLHRSEGLGLGMMEAMSMGKPVIGTRFGGNLEFMNDDNSLLVDYQLVPIAQDLGPYQQGWLWGEADVKQAAAYMRLLYEDRLFATQLGMKAKAFIETNFNPDVFRAHFIRWSMGQ